MLFSALVCSLQLCPETADAYFVGSGYYGSYRYDGSPSHYDEGVKDKTGSNFTFDDTKGDTIPDSQKGTRKVYGGCLYHNLWANKNGLPDTVVVENNSLTLTKKTLTNSDYSIYGGYVRGNSGTHTLNNNHVNISGPDLSLVHGSIYGSCAYEGEFVKAQNSSVTLTDVTFSMIVNGGYFNTVAGGSAYSSASWSGEEKIIRTAESTNNRATLNNVTIKEQQDSSGISSSIRFFGGYAGGYAETTASSNTLVLNNVNYTGDKTAIVTQGWYFNSTYLLEYFLE